jgi:peptidoglycan/xylan/chitin deacetylase (PgdA/CDA1 family)
VTIARQLRDVLEVPRDLLLRRYPAFVTGGDLPRGHVPVFVFHGLVHDRFAAKLEYLADNGYRTLSAAEYLDVLRGRVAPPERAVVLTFDDGRRSVFTVGLPLMQRFGMKGIVFLVPGRTPEVAADEVREGSEGLMPWSEVTALSRSGHFDIESHALSHARVHVAPSVVGFLAPPMQHGYAAMDVPLIGLGGRDLFAAEAPLGTPLLRSAPRLSEAPRFIEDEAFRAPCVQLVRDAGGDAFFQRSDWEQRLRVVLPRGPIAGRYETAGERIEAVRHELADARRLIQERTGRPAVHLCYPWHVSGPTAERLAGDAGYETAFCGKVPGVPITLPGGDLRRIARIGEDYLELLPGRGRRTLAGVLRKKWMRRFG